MGCSKTNIFGIGVALYTSICIWLNVSHWRDVAQDGGVLQNEGGYSRKTYHAIYSCTIQQQKIQKFATNEDIDWQMETTDDLLLFSTTTESQAMQYEPSSTVSTEVITTYPPPTSRYIYEKEPEWQNITLYNYSRTITQEKLETFQAILPPVLPDYRNPCWYERVPDNFQYEPYHSAKNFTHIANIIRVRCDNIGSQPCWRLRCFPYFFLIGAGKAGTTDLFSMLRIFHPNVATNSVKEPLFWGILRRNRNPATYAQYLDQFDDSAELIRRKTTILNGSTVHPLIFGDFSPNTYTCAPSWEKWPGNINQSEPLITTPHLIHRIRPETKIIFSFREPVVKTISHFFYGHIRAHASMDDLHAFCKSAIDQFHNCVAEHSVRFCVFSGPNIVYRGLYYVFLRDWLSLFPHKHIFIYRFEEYIKDRVKILNQISKFLEIDPIPSKYNKIITNFRPHNVNAGKTERGPVPTAVIDMLTEFYRPWQTKMEDIYLHDKRLWRDDEQQTVNVMMTSNTSSPIESME